jgi:predicted oxidoreductase
MKKIDLGKSGFLASEISLGCMRLTSLSKKEANVLINTAIENEITFFEHADIYGGGECESLFAQSIEMNNSIREKIQIQTKCGIRAGFFDFSKEHILNSVDNSLKKLQTDYIDLLVLHRPDTLVEPEEVAEAFDILEQSGKVKYFGVSNQNPMQIQLLSKFVKQKLIVNQLQFSITNTELLNSSFNVNMQNDAAINRDGSVFDFCRLSDITIQAWSPFQHGFFAGTFIDNPEFEELNDVLEKIAEENDVTKSAVAIAWILRHPAKIQTIVGTTNAKRLTEIAKASDVSLSRQEWYEIYKSAGNRLP